jgi:flavin-dependent dehydrogenase
MTSVDVAIIGASLAGASCARELARCGVDAVAFERDRFPREKVCGGFLSPGAVESLRELGLLESIRRAGAVEVRSARVRLLDTELNLDFPQCGLGISRRTLDAVLASGIPVWWNNVRGVHREGDGFRVELDDRDVRAKVLVDAAGKLSRFTQHQTVEEFGVQFYENAPQGDVLDFWFFEDGYGGAVSIEDGRRNACFLIRKEALPRYIGRPGCRVTGPLAYRSLSSDLIGVGDAAGMIDPFCGEGIHHALDSGLRAARAIALGLRESWSYDRIQRHYASARRRRWAGKRVLGHVIRKSLQHPLVVAAGISMGIERLVRAMWKSEIDSARRLLPPPAPS